MGFVLIVPFPDSLGDRNQVKTFVPTATQGSTQRRPSQGNPTSPRTSRKGKSSVSSPPRTAGPSKPRGQPSTQARQAAPASLRTQARQDAPAAAAPTQVRQDAPAAAPTQAHQDALAAMPSNKGGADIAFIQVNATPDNLLGKRKCIGQYFTDRIK